MKADAHHAYAPNKQMFLLAVKARIVTCAMKILGLDKIDSSPTKYLYPKDKSRLDKGIKRVYIEKLASQIVDEFIVDEKSYNRVVELVLNDHHKKQAIQSKKPMMVAFMQAKRV